MGGGNEAEIMAADKAVTEQQNKKKEESKNDKPKSGEDGERAALRA